MSKAVQVSTKTLLLSALLFAAATGCGDDKVEPTGEVLFLGRVLDPTAK